MQSRTIKYETFDGDEVTEVAYFHMSKPEMLRLEVKYPGGFGGMIRGITERNEENKALAIIETMILDSYGRKSDDGKRFEKSEEISRAFSETAAYEKLFDELTESADALLTFIKGVFPKEMAEQIEAAEKADKEKANQQTTPTS